MSTGNEPRARNTRTAHIARQLQAREHQRTLNTARGTQYAAGPSTQGSSALNVSGSIPTWAPAPQALVVPGRGRQSAHAQNVSMAREYDDHPEEVASLDYKRERVNVQPYEPELIYTTAPVVSDHPIEGTPYDFPLDKGKRRARDVLPQDDESSSLHKRNWETLDERLRWQMEENHRTMLKAIEHLAMRHRASETTHPLAKKGGTLTTQIR